MTAREVRRSRATRLLILGLSLLAVGLVLMAVYGGGMRWQAVTGMAVALLGGVPIIRASLLLAGDER